MTNLRPDSQTSHVKRLSQSIRDSVGIEVDIQRHVFDLYTHTVPSREGREDLIPTTYSIEDDNQTTKNDKDDSPKMNRTNEFERQRKRYKTSRMETPSLPARKANNRSKNQKEISLPKNTMMSDI